MRPMLEGDLNCTQECLSDGNVPTTSSAAQAALSARGPMLTLGKPPWSRLGQGLESGWSSWLRNGGTPIPGTPGQVTSDGTRSALPPAARETEAPPKGSRGESFSALEQDRLAGHTLGTSFPEVRGPPRPAGAAGSLSKRAGSPSLGRWSLSVPCPGASPSPGGKAWGCLGWQDTQILLSR